MPISSLKSEPYSLPWGSSVYAKVLAMNLVGLSEFSDIGNGAIILTTPEAPQLLQNNVAITNKDQIGLTWYEPLNNAGTPVIDYRIWYAIQTEVYQVLEVNLVELFYIAKPLVSG